MIQNIIRWSLDNKVIVAALVLALIGWGSVSVRQLPLDAIPDVTSNQVNVVTIAPNLAPVEMEQFVTYPVEMALTNIKGLTEMRSTSQFGLSLITLEFTEATDLYWARTQINECLQKVKEEIPNGFGAPEMLPVTTGLGEVFQYKIEPIDPKDTTWSLMQLRDIQDWTVRRQLMGTEGVAEISSFGGFARQIQVVVNPDRLKSLGLTLQQVFDAVEKGNANTGAAYIERYGQAYFIRGVGLATSKTDLENTFIHSNGGVPVAVRDVATIEDGAAVRFGALTDHKSEIVGGIVLMLKGENSRQVVVNIKERFKNIEKNLPKGLKITPFIDREDLIDRTIATVFINLLEGGIIVILVLLLLLGNLRAGLIIASVIPLSMLFAVGCMVLFGVSGNLMSLGAIDFGLIVDGAVIIVENVIHHFQKLKIKNEELRLDLAKNTEGVSEASEDVTSSYALTMSQPNVVFNATSEIMRSAVFGSIIIMIVYVPLLLLQGIEGKMFQPMALTVLFSLLGALILSLTYVPVVCDLLLKMPKSTKPNLADRIIAFCIKLYKPLLINALNFKKIIVGVGIGLLVAAFLLFQTIGGEFIPQLDEGDYAVQVTMMPSTSLSQMVETANAVGTKLLAEFPNEISATTGKIGSSEIPTDPMSFEEMDMILTMKPRKLWVKCRDRADFESQLNAVLKQIVGIETSIQQPIAMRFNELMTGAKTDVIVKILGNDLDKLADLANKIEETIKNTEGVTDLNVAKAEGMPQLFVTYKRDALLRFGVSVEEIGRTLRMALAGEKAGVLYEDSRRYDVMIKLKANESKRLTEIGELMVLTENNSQIPLKQLANIEIKNAPMAVFRDDGERSVNVNLNVRGRDVASAVADIQRIVAEQIQLPQGYRVTYGGQFENLENARNRLLLVVPAALLLILLLLYISFGDFRVSLLIFSAIPFAAVGGIFALILRGMPFSISAGVGFIALFGVAVLNGMVLIGQFNSVVKSGEYFDFKTLIAATISRFRPVVMTATVASLGFLPMALATGAGAEVQKPLATVVIGGLITSTFLTLIVLPILYALFFMKKGNLVKIGAILLISLSNSTVFAKNDPLSIFKEKCCHYELSEAILRKAFTYRIPLRYPIRLFQTDSLPTALTEQQAIEIALKRNPIIGKNQVQIDQAKTLIPTAKTLPPTDFFVETPQRYMAPDNSAIWASFGAQQTWQPAKVYRQNEKVLTQAVEVAKAEKAVTEHDVRHQTRLLYQQCLYTKAKMDFLKQQDSLFSEFNRVAEVEARTGKITALEKLSLASFYQNYQHLLRGSILENQHALDALATYLGRPQVGVNQLFMKLDTPQYSTKFQLPIQDFYRQNQQLETEKLAQQKLATTTPKYSIGLTQLVFNQLIPPFIRGGVSIPLWTKSYKAQYEAAAFSRTIAEIERANADLELRAAHQKAVNTLALAIQNLDFYEKTALPQARQILVGNLKQRQLGAIATAEYLQNMRLAFDVELQFWERLQAYNAAVLVVQYFTNN